MNPHRMTAGAGAQLLPQSRWASLIRACYGVALIFGARQLITLSTGRVPSRRACAVGRLLGARHLAQATVCGAMPTRWLITAGSAADVLHSASMLALAGEDPGLRPALLTDAGIAGGFAAAGGAFLRAQGGTEWRL